MNHQEWFGHKKATKGNDMSVTKLNEILMPSIEVTGFSLAKKRPLRRVSGQKVWK